MASAGDAYNAAFDRSQGNVLAAFKAMDARRQEEFLNQLRMRNQAIEEKKAGIEMQIKGVQMAKELNSAMREQDKAVRGARLAELIRKAGGDTNTPETKERIKVLTNAGPEASQRIANGASVIAANGGPEAGMAIPNFVTGKMGFEEAETAAKRASAGRTLGRVANGQPSVTPQAAMPVETSRVAAPQMPPMQPASPADPLAQRAQAGVKGGTANAREALGIPDAAGPMTMNQIFQPPKMAPTAKAAVAQPRGGVDPATAPTADGQLDALLGTIGQAESSMNPRAKNPRSSASGLFQYIDSTWLDSVARQKPDWARGMTKREILASRFDADRATEIMKNDAARYIAMLEGNGFAGSGGNVYMLHHFGPLGARAILDADASAPMTSVVPRAVIKANPQYADMTAGEVRRSFEIKHGAEPLIPSSSSNGMTSDVAATAPNTAEQRVSANRDTPNTASNPFQARADAASGEAKTMRELEAFSTSEIAKDTPGAKESAIFAKDRASTAETNAAGQKGQARLFDQVQNGVGRLKAAILDTSPDDWAQSTGGVGGALPEGVLSSAWADVQRVTENILSRTGLDTGRSGQSVRAPIQAASNALLETNRALMKANGVSDSDFSNADREFMDLVAPIQQGMTQEEAVKYIDETIVPYWQDKFGESVNPQMPAPKNSKSTLDKAKKEIAQGDRTTAMGDLSRADISSLFERFLDTLGY